MAMLMEDDHKNEKDQPHHDGDEAPAIFSLGHADGKPTITRRTFLEIAAAVSGATLGGLGVSTSLLADEENSATGTNGKVVYAHSKAVRSLTISPDGKWLVSGGEEGKLKLWTLPAGALAKCLDASASSLDALAFSSDGIFLISGSRSYSNDNIQLWRFPDLKEEKNFRPPKGDSSFLPLAVGPDSASVASVCDKKVRLLSLPEGKQLSTSEADLEAIPSKVVFTPDGKHLLEIDGSEYISVLSIPKFQLERQLPIDSNAPQQASKKSQINASDSEIQTTNGEAEPDPALKKLLTDAETQPGAAFELAGKYASGNGVQQDAKKAVKWYERAAEQGHTEAAYNLGACYEYGIGVAEDRTKAIHWYHAAAEAGHAWAKKKLETLVPGLVGTGTSFAETNRKPEIWAHKFACITITPDGHTVIAGRKNGAIELIALEAGSILKSLKGHTDVLNALAVTGDGKLLASAGDDTAIKLWSIPDGELLKTLSGHAKKVNALAISPDGKLLASGSDDKTIRLWSLPDGKELFCLMGTIRQRRASPTSLRRKAGKA
jgi:WD40 repeat protein